MIDSGNLCDKLVMIKAIQHALDHSQGLAIGKLGFSEQLTLLFYLASKTSKKPETDPLVRPVYLALKYHCERQMGVFPTNIQFLLRYSAFYQKQVTQADFLGLFGSPNEAKILASLPFTGQFVHFTDTEPDRSTPYLADHCYLPLLRGKKILLVAPFASFAQQRASKEIFEATWHKIGAQWFYPKSIEAIDIPYSTMGQDNTFEEFGNSQTLYENISQAIDSHDYDVALIAAGSLAVPLAVHIKHKQKVAISLGGHFQVLFGILGDRWTRDKFWKEEYINEAWTRLPKNFIPENAHELADNKSYW